MSYRDRIRDGRTWLLGALMLLGVAAVAIAVHDGPWTRWFLFIAVFAWITALSAVRFGRIAVFAAGGFVLLAAVARFVA